MFRIEIALADATRDWVYFGRLDAEETRSDEPSLGDFALGLLHAVGHSAFYLRA
jgi:hypothetical protein